MGSAISWCRVGADLYWKRKVAKCWSKGGRIIPKWRDFQVNRHLQTIWIHLEQVEQERNTSMTATRKPSLSRTRVVGWAGYNQFSESQLNHLCFVLALPKGQKHTSFLMLEQDQQKIHMELAHSSHAKFFFFVYLSKMWKFCLLGWTSTKPLALRTAPSAAGILRAFPADCWDIFFFFFFRTAIYYLSIFFS